MSGYEVEYDFIVDSYVLHFAGEEIILTAKEQAEAEAEAEAIVANWQ